MIKVGLLGANGRMGSLIKQLIPTEFSNQAVLYSQIKRGDSFEVLLKSDVIIDVSQPAALCDFISLASSQKSPIPPLVVGSTGWTTEQKEKLNILADHTAILVASNFSVGVYAVSEILKNYSPLFIKLGYTPVLVEAHHCHKKDAPSGTALNLLQKINPENPTQVQTHSIRAGEVIGNHEVTFYGPVDQIVIGHFAQQRSVFARGAIEIAIWLAQKQSSSHPIRGIIGIESYFEHFKKSI